MYRTQPLQRSSLAIGSPGQTPWKSLPTRSKLHLAGSCLEMDQPQRGGMSNYTFAGDWPKPCPPGDSVPANGRVYRLARNNPHSISDIQSHHQSGPKAGRDFEPCYRCALSVIISDEPNPELVRNCEPRGREESTTSWNPRATLGLSLATEPWANIP